MKKFIFALFLLPISVQLFAQQTFITKGRIEFEKKENIYKTIESLSWGDDDNGGGDNSFIEQMKKTMPQFQNTYFNLYFDETHTLYKPGKEAANQNIPEWFQGPGAANIVHTDLNTQLQTSQKTAFGSTILVQDTARKIEWRITSDTRTIAGFECRKAVGKILDSVYVIAFYTDQILPSGGPESFTGLPGMILGIAIPRINTTWFATKLEIVPIAPTDLTLPAKGKKYTPGDFKKKIADSMKDWGKFGKRNLIEVMI